MAAEFSILGLEGVQAKLKSLSGRFAYNAARRSLGAGARVIRDQAIANAKRLDDPETNEQIWKNIAAYGGGRARENRVGGAIYRVGVRGGARFQKSGEGLPGGNTTGYWRLQEFGTVKQKAQPFMRPAMATKLSEAISVIVGSINKELDKEIKRNVR